MSRTFPRASFRVFCLLLLVSFGYLYLHRSRCASAGAWAPPASSRSVCSSFLDLDAIAATLHSSVVYCPQDTVCSMAWSCSTRLRVESNIGQVTGVAPARRTPPGRLAISAGRARPGAARAPRPALIPKRYKARRRKAERSLKPPPTLPTRLALGLALLGLLPSPEVVVPIVLVRRRRAPVRRVVALVEAPAAALARREVLGPRLLAAVADLR